MLIKLSFHRIMVFEGFWEEDMDFKINGLKSNTDITNHKKAAVKHSKSPTLHTDDIFTSTTGAKADDSAKLKALASKKKAAKTAKSELAPSPLGDVSVEVPFDKHLEEGVQYVLDKTVKKYPGFQNNRMGMTKKGSQVHSHLKDFIDFVKEENKGDLAALPDKERKDVINRATGFIADKTADKYGMAPHMRRNAIFLSPIRANVSDYLEFLNKQNIVISKDNKGNLKATQYFSKEAALKSLNGGRPESNRPEENLEVVTEKQYVIIGGVRLPVNPD